MYRRTQKGFTLAEVLASVFVLAIGLIGAAGMQMHALRTAQQSAFHTAALSLATEMADMLRMSLSSADSHALLETYLQIDLQPGGNSAHGAASCYRVSCDAKQLVEFNIGQWKQRIEAVLPGARAKVCVDEQAWNGQTGQPSWMCRSPIRGNGRASGAIVVKIGWQDKTAVPGNGATANTAQEFPPLLVMTVAPYVR